MSKPKIDFIISKMSSGGAERVVANLANYFSIKGYKVRIITFNKGSHYTLNKEITLVELHKKFIIKSTTINGIYQLLKFYSNKLNRPDIISSHIGMLSYITLPVSKLYNIKIIISEHFNHKFQPTNFFKKILWNKLYKYSDALTILTKFDYEFFSHRNKKIIVMENPTSFEIIDQKQEDRRKVILAVGNLDRFEHKGFDNLLEIAKEVLPNHPKWKINIIGSGTNGKILLEKKITALKLEDKVKLLGFKDNIKEIMSSSEVFILTSRNEGLPMVLLEAISQGMACISYDCISGPSDIIENGKNGLLIEDQNMNSMINSLDKLLLDEQLRIKLRENGPLSINRFSIEKVGWKWEKLINEVLTIN